MPGVTSAVVPPSYILQYLFVYGLQEYGHLDNNAVPIMLLVLFCFVIKDRKMVKYTLLLLSIRVAECPLV